MARPVLIDADYPGVCATCEAPYPSGTRLALVELKPSGRHGWQHADGCPDAPGPAGPKPGELVCPDCWLIHRPGACDRG